MDAPIIKNQIKAPLLDNDGDNPSKGTDVVDISAENVQHSKINPFLTRKMEKEFVLYAIFKWIIGVLVLLPIRCLLTLFLLLFMILFVSLSTCCLQDPDAPLTGWARFCLWTTQKLGRLLLFVWGYYWITTHGEPVLDSRRAPIVVSNHVSILDGGILFNTYGGSLISRSENASVPLIGGILKGTRAILVDRQDPNSRFTAQKAIVDRAKQAQTSQFYKPLMIFPEGTTTNGLGMIGFKKGAFVPGLSVQPVCIVYNNKYCDVSWPPYNDSVFRVMFGVFRQFVNFAEVYYLPPYIPSAAEIADPQLFANNVRLKMSEVSGIPVTGHSFEDFRLMIEAKKHHMPETSLSGFQLSLLDNFNVPDARNMLKEFAASNQSKTGELNLEEFAKLIKLPVSSEVRQLFALMDTNEDGYISFKEYILGLASFGKKLNVNDSVIQYSFQIFDINGKGSVDKSEFQIIMRNRFPDISDEVIDQLWASVDSKGTGSLTYEQFSEFAKNNPHYVKLAEKMIQKKKKEGLIPPDLAKLVEDVN